MKTKPVFLNIFHIRLPITAIASILHRLSGMALFFMMPVVLWVWKRSLDSERGFLRMQEWLSAPVFKTFAALFLIALVYHLLAGVRHLFMDAGFGETKAMGRFTSAVVIGLTAAFAAVLNYQWGLF